MAKKAPTLEELLKAPTSNTTVSPSAAGTVSRVPAPKVTGKTSPVKVSDLLKAPTSNATVSITPPGSLQTFAPPPAITETRNPPVVTSPGSVKGLAEGSDQVDLSKMTPAAYVQYLATKNYMPTSAADFAGIASRYQDALAGYNAPQLAAQRQQMSEEVNAQTLAAQRQMRSMQGQQGIRGAAAQGGMQQISNQGQKAIAGSERDLLVRNQAVQAQALDRFAVFMQSERGQRLAGMLTSADLGQRAAADAEYRTILQQYLANAQTQTGNAQDAANRGGFNTGLSMPQTYDFFGKVNPMNPGGYFSPGGGLW